MTQNTYNIADSAGAVYRAAVNTALQALASTNSGNSRPSTAYAGQQWIDTNTPSTSVWTLYLYDGTDDIPLGLIDTTNNIYTQFTGGTSDYISSVGGTGNAITLTPTIATPSLQAGQSRSFVAAANNSGAVTVSDSGLTATALTKNGSTALSPGDIVIGRFYTIKYDGTQYQLMNIAASGGLLAANNLSDLASASSARSNLGLGTAAVLNTGTTNGTIPLVSTGNKISTSLLDVGTGVNQIVQLNSSSQLPAIDGSQLNNLPSTLPSITTTATTSGSSKTITVDFTTYNSYRIYFDDTSSTSTGAWLFEASSNGGASYASSNYMIKKISTATVTAFSSGIAALANNSYTLVGYIDIYQNSITGYATFSVSISNTTSGGEELYIGQGQCQVSAAINRIKITPSGNFDSGRVSIVPLAKR